MDTAHEGPVEKGSPSRHGSKPGGLTASIKHDADFHLLLERGRPISIEHGASVWRAIYWGRDETGEIVAYNSDGHWRLIRVDLRSMVDVSRMVAASARVREETRGAHFRQDFPKQQDDYGLFNTCLRRGANGLPEMEKKPVVFKHKSLAECQQYRKG